MDVSSLAPGLPAAPVPQPAKRAVEQRDSGAAAEQFTSLLVSMVVKEMWKTVSIDGDGPFGNAPGAEVYRGMAETAFADALAKNGMKSLTDQIQVHIDRLRHKAGEEDA